MNTKGLFVIICATLLILPSLVAADISVEKKDKGSVVIAELDNPAVYDFTITNTGAPENIEFFTLVGIPLSPRGSFEIPSGVSNLEVRAYPPANVRRVTGPYVFEYQIKGSATGLFKDTLSLTVVNLKDALILEPTEFKPGMRSLQLTIKNTQNTFLTNVKLDFSSAFFENQQTISLKPYESTTLTIPIDAEKARAHIAGKYILTAKATLDGVETPLEGVLTYKELKEVSEATDAQGFLIHKKTITRTNTGNIPTQDTVTISRDILTRLFTISSLEPVTVDRHSLYVTYNWNKELQPGESWTLTTTTNYTLPFVLLLLIIISVLAVQRYARTRVVTHKTVTYVRTKGGQFALKVRLTVKARAPVTNVQVIDRLPGMTKIYEKFGSKPDRIDAATRRLFWSIQSLQAGEERVFSYIVYSTVTILGRFELPAAMVMYEHAGKTEETSSNRAFFISDTVKSVE